MRRRRQALPCALTTALFLLRNPGSCPLLIGLQSAERRHAFFALSASLARLADPLEPGEVVVGRKKTAPTRLSRGGISVSTPRRLRSSRPQDRPRGSTFVASNLDRQHNQVIVPGTHATERQPLDDRNSLAE